MDDDLLFQTTGQNLFGAGGATQQKYDFALNLLNQSLPRTRLYGNVVHTPAQIPVSVLQSVWQKAINTCTSKTYSGFSPTTNECISGSGTRTVCILDSPLGCIKHETRTVSFGSGIGPKPTHPTNRSYDIGVEFTSEYNIRVGLDGELTVDPGSVDVNYPTKVKLTTDRDDAAVGEVVTISTSQTVDEAGAKIESRYPNVDLSLAGAVGGKIAIDMRQLMPDFTNGDQLDTTTHLYYADTKTNPVSDTTGYAQLADILNSELFGVNVGTGGVKVRVLGEESDIITDLASAALTGNITFPPKAPPGTPLFPLADYGVNFPQLDTPAASDFDCGDCSAVGGVKRNVVTDSSLTGPVITSTTPVGDRTVGDGLFDENGKIKIPTVTGANQDGDVLRFDLDADSISLIAGVPLGVEFRGPPVKNPFKINGKTVGPEGLGKSIGVELNALDLDLVNFFSFDQELDFQPNLYADLSFDKPTLVRIGSSGSFHEVTKISFRVGDDLQMIQPEGGVNITPHYHLQHNTFTNDTDFVYTPAVQFTEGEIKLTGWIPAILKAITGLESTDFALAQFTQEFSQPIKITSLADPKKFSLDGFNDFTGASFAIAETAGSGGGPMPVQTVALDEPFLTDGTAGDPVPGWTVTGPGSAAIVVDPFDAGNLVAELTTGSPVEIARLLTTPDRRWRLGFDYLFEDALGVLDFFLRDPTSGDQVTLGQLDGSSGPLDMWRRYDMVFDDPALFDLVDWDLVFRFDAPVSGQQVLLDNVRVSDVPAPASAGLMLAGIIGLAGLRRRQRPHPTPSPTPPPPPDSSSIGPA